MLLFSVLIIIMCAIFKYFEKNTMTYLIFKWLPALLSINQYVQHQSGASNKSRSQVGEKCTATEHMWHSSR